MIHPDIGPMNSAYAGLARRWMVFSARRCQREPPKAQFAFCKPETGARDQAWRKQRIYGQRVEDDAFHPVINVWPPHRRVTSLTLY